MIKQRVNHGWDISFRWMIPKNKLMVEKGFSLGFCLKEARSCPIHLNIVNLSEIHLSLFGDIKLKAAVPKLNHEKYFSIVYLWYL